MLSKILGRIIEVVSIKRRTTIAIGIAVLCASLPFSVMLYTNLRSAIEELLPANAPSIKALNEMHNRLGDNMQLGLHLSGPSVDKLHAFADELAARSNNLGKNAPRLIDYRPSEIQSFFTPRRALYIDLEDLNKIEHRLDEHIAYARRSANPFDLGLEDPPPSFNEIFDRYKEQQTILRNYPSGYYDGADGHSLAMVFYPRQGASGYQASLRFRDAIANIANIIKQEMHLADLHLEFTGDVETVIQEQHSLQKDLLTSSIFVLLLEAILLLIFFRWFPSLLALGLPLAAGTATTLAISYGFLGSLNASTAFLGAIIVGNGVNPGIILLSRFVEERRQATPQEAAMRIAVHATALPTIIAATAAALAYGALLVTTFRGYSQFGFMGAIGMFLCWGATYLCLPPLALALEKRWPINGKVRSLKSSALNARIDRYFAHIGTLAVNNSLKVITFGALATVLAIVAVLNVGNDPFEQDTTKLRSSWATEPNGYISVAKKMDAILKRLVTPIIVLTETTKEVEPIAERYRQLVDQGEGKTLIGGVLTLQGLVPKQQTEKLAIISNIRKKLTPVVRHQLDVDTQKLISDWMPPVGLKPFLRKDLPQALIRQFTENDGTVGRLILLFPRYGITTTNGHVVQRLAKEARSVPIPDNVYIAGSYLIFADMLSSIGHDGPIATITAFLGVLILSLLLARMVRDSKIARGMHSTLGGLQVTIALLVGVIWTVGIAAIGGMRLNFLNFIALPITFGIGVDYATNIYGRYRQAKPSSKEIVSAVSHSGAAVAACSATTIIGYSSLLLSRNGALFSFGLLAVMGEIACLATALLILPAALSLVSLNKNTNEKITAEEQLKRREG
ncbi:MAG: MMPL family transporter [Deltaproteobacteria bacterium]|nr:MMPL family transporter [Deltaproteobacteria bacterium]